MASRPWFLVALFLGCSVLSAQAGHAHADETPTSGAAAMAVVESTGADLMALQVDAIFRAASGDWSRKIAHCPPTVKRELEEVVQKTKDRMQDRIEEYGLLAKEFYADEYSKRFTYEELLELKAFFARPVVKAYYVRQGATFRPDGEQVEPTSEEAVALKAFAESILGEKWQEQLAEVNRLAAESLGKYFPYTKLAAIAAAGAQELRAKLASLSKQPSE
jgi:hypothetical protein